MMHENVEDRWNIVLGEIWELYIDIQWFHDYIISKVISHL